ncbi:MAG TPA: phosphoribosyltransferase [Bryobacteraceae bacterium]|nr:phosphoribosyltransferase [Bryobacteraceae bacterium]
MAFRDRVDAGRQLAQALLHYTRRSDVTVLALPRGGVPVGYEVALALDAPLDVFLVRKLGVPGHEELAMGAIAEGGVRVLNHDVIEDAGVRPDEINEVATRELEELARRAREYRGEKTAPHLDGRIAILVDDGLATGATMRAAIAALRPQHPARIVVAVPVAAQSTYREFRGAVDEIVAIELPERFYAVGAWYEDFSQTTDEEIRSLLASSARAHRN